MRRLTRNLPSGLTGIHNRGLGTDQGKVVWRGPATRRPSAMDWAWRITTLRDEEGKRDAFGRYTPPQSGSAFDVLKAE